VLELGLLIDPPADGAWNMAVDEALLESAAAGRATLRFYRWTPATLSLGYFQAASDRTQHAASRDCPLVRRASGGGAIVHDRELTYSIALPQQTPRGMTAAALYDLFHQTLISALAEIGVVAELHRPPTGTCEAELRQNAAEPFLCFQRRSCGDIVYGGSKIVGSAQRRRRGAVLQHGSILLARSEYAPELPGIEDQFAKRQGRAPHLDEGALIGFWTRRLAARLPAQWKPVRLSSQQRDLAKSLAQERFGARAFTHQR
jgi:lipoate-protein ligase A